MSEIEVRQDWCKACGAPQPGPCVLLPSGPVGFDCFVKQLAAYSGFTEAMEEELHWRAEGCCRDDDGEPLPKARV